MLYFWSMLCVCFATFVCCLINLEIYVAALIIAPSIACGMLGEKWIQKRSKSMESKYQK